MSREIASSAGEEGIASVPEGINGLGEGGGTGPLLPFSYCVRAHHRPCVIQMVSTRPRNWCSTKLLQVPKEAMKSVRS